MKKILLFVFGLCSTAIVYAQNCDIPLIIAFNEETENMPEASRNILANRLKQVLTSNGITGNMTIDQFALIPRYDVIDKHVTAGPPPQVTYNLSFTFAIKDLCEDRVFSTCNIDVDAVGENETKAFINGVRQISASSSQIQKCMEMARAKIVSFYDRNYDIIVKKVNALAELKKYDEALYHIMSIPECCKSYSNAMILAVSLYKNYADRNGKILLMKAKAIWGSGNNDEAAKQAAELLTKIDPDASCYSEAETLLNEIKAKASKNQPWNFEMQIYRDQISIEKQKMDAARAVGVAFGKGQKQTTTNLMFVR